MSAASIFREPKRSFVPTRAKPKIRIGVLLSGREQFSPYFGGALARWTYEVYSRLVEEVDATVFGFPVSKSDRYPFPFKTHRASTVCKLLGGIRGIRRFEDSIWLRSLRYDLNRVHVLHVHNRPQWIRRLREIGYSGKLILHLQNEHLGHWSPTMLDELARDVDLVLSCSTYLQNTFAARSQAIAAKSRVLLNGVDIVRFCPTTRSRNHKTIFYVGRLSEEKGVLQLLRAFTLVRRSHPDAKLMIAGTTGFGVHKEDHYVMLLRREAREIVGQGGDVALLGYLHHDRDLPRYFQESTMFVCPSLFQEPFGLVNAEAMACGTPVVASNRGGIPEVVGSCGLLVNPEDAEEMSKAIIQLLDFPELRAKLAQDGRDRCEAIFDWAKVADNLVTTIHTIA